MSRITAGVIGTGFMGRVHARAITAAGYDVTAVAGSRPGSAQVLQRELQRARAMDDARAVIDSDVDVVHVCVPNHLHASLTSQVIAAGKHVVCEKPLATTVEDAEALHTAAAEAGIVATVPFVYRYHEVIREARSRIASDGQHLWLLHGSYLQDWLASRSDTNWRVDPALGGHSRAFGDIGVHWCDLMEFVTGHRITEVSAQFARAFPHRAGQAESAAPATEDGAVVSFRTDRGAVGSVVLSQATAGRKNRLWFSFDGPDASFSWDQETPDVLWIGGRDANQLVLRDPSRLGAPALPRSLPTGHPQGYYEAFTDFVADTYAAIAGEPSDPPTFAAGVRAARITEAVTASALEEASAWVPVEPALARQD